MKRYLLDTNIVSHLIRGDDPEIDQRVAALKMPQILVSVVTHAELWYGAARRGHPVGLTASLNAFFDRAEVMPWTLDVSLVYSTLRTQFERPGISLGSMDMMIAAHAHALNLQAAESKGSVVLVSRDRVFTLVAGTVATEAWGAR